MYIFTTMHLPILLSVISAITVPLVSALPSPAQSDRPSQIYKTTNNYPLPNPGNLPVHDPNILYHDSNYYLFKGGIHVPIYKSANITGPWTELGTVLDSDSVIHQGNRSRPWAPTTIHKNGLFYCYYTLSAQGSRNSSIGVATTPVIDGTPWTDHGAVINTGTGPGSDVYPYTVTNAIDASVVFDEDSGQAYLNYGSFWQGIWQVPLADEMVSVEDAGKPDAVQLAFIPKEKRKPIEGAWMSYRSGFYYLWFSHGKCCHFQKGFPAPGKEYSIRVGRSKSVRGPFVDRKGTSLIDGGGTVVYGSNHGVVYAPGGLGVLNGSEGLDVLYYHYLNTSVGFKNGQAQLGWNYLDYEDGWPVPVGGQDPTTTSAASTHALPVRSYSTIFFG